jgi:hypothetical protein
MGKADIAGDLERPDRVIGLTEAALREPSQVLPRIRALILRLRGRAYASLGNTGECARALDAAQAEVLRPYDGPDDLPARVYRYGGGELLEQARSV